MLAAHEMFSLFLGNPQTITMIASIYHNPHMTKMNSLVDLYNSMKNEKSAQIEEYDFNHEG